MANPFDQFDTPVSGSTPAMKVSANPFDQFDIPDQPVSSTNTVPITSPRQQSQPVVEPEQAQSDLLMEPIRVGREAIGAIVGAGTKAYHGITRTIPAFLGTAAATPYGEWDQALQAGADENAILQKKLQAQQEILPVSQSLTSKGMNAVIEPTVEAAEKATGDTGFVKAGTEALMDVAALVPGAKLANYGMKQLPKKMTPERWVTKLEKKLNPINNKLQKDITRIAPPKNKNSMTPDQFKDYTNKSYQAGVNFMEDLKNGTLEFVDAEGFPVKNRLPTKNINELATANSNALKNIGAEIEALKGTNVDIPLSEAVSGVEAFYKNRVNRTIARDATKAAETMADDFRSLGKVSPTELQDMIAHYNAVKYGKIIDPNIPNQPYLAAQVVRELQKVQNAYFESLGVDMAGIKSRYSAHKTVQNGLDKMYAKAMSKATHTPLSMWEGAALHQAFVGDFSSAAIAKGIAAFNKMARNPDRAVGSFFDGVKKRQAIEARLPKKDVVTEPQVQGPPTPKMVIDTSTGKPMRADSAGSMRNPTALGATEPAPPAPMGNPRTPTALGATEPAPPAAMGNPRTPIQSSVPEINIGTIPAPAKGQPIRMNIIKNGKSVAIYFDRTIGKWREATRQGN